MMIFSRTWSVFPLILLLWAESAHCAAPPDVADIIKRSVAANRLDFEAAPGFDHKERDRTWPGTKTYQITMIDGSPYQRLIAMNGKPLSPAQQAEEQRKQEAIRRQRSSEAPTDRQKRIAQYEKDRTRNNEMMKQLTVAFDFAFVGERKLEGRTVWVLKATPRPGYQPPNMDTQVLRGMEGELWIDDKTYQWVKVTARVIHPVSIEGFLAQVEPGTQFELETAPVAGGSWQPSHFGMRSHAKVLFLFNRASQAEETYFDYQPTAGKR